MWTQNFCQKGKFVGGIKRFRPEGQESGENSIQKKDRPQSELNYLL